MWPFKKKTLEDRLNETKKIKVCGIFFEIRKISAIDFLNGSHVLQRLFDTYQIKQADEAITNNTINQMKKHYSDVFLSAVVSPKIARNKDEDGIFVENLFTDWDLASELFQEIMVYTYGKKNFKPNTLQGRT